jgi:RNA polymerase sigma factor (sigma-70 family)
MDKESQFQTVLLANSDRIYRICCCHVRDETMRQDVFQTVLLHLWESWETFQGGSQISTWIFRIAVNTCLGYLRTGRRGQRLLAQVAGQARLTGVPLSPSPTETCGTRDEIERLYECIHQLPPLDRVLVSLCLEEATTDEIAEVLGISPANARVKVHRVKKTLREIWERTDDGLE